MFKRLLGIGSNPNQMVVDALYEAIVAAARQPVFYSRWGVPDTPLGRFEMLSLSLFLVLRRLRGEKGVAADIAQELVDTFITDVEHSIRELGIGDVAVPKRMKKLARMFYGRVESYGAALDACDETQLAAALARNVRPAQDGWPHADGVARYTCGAANALAAQPIDKITAGAIEFPSAEATRTGETA